jgi:YfiH family protein
MHNQINFIIPDWPVPSTVKAYTTLRHAWGTPLHPLFSEESEKNLKNLLSLPASPIWLKQTHGIELIEALAKNNNSPADASFSRQINQVCVILTADCLPILLYHRSASLVAAIHAGWRGLANGIIEQTLHHLQQNAKNWEDWIVWLGPAISAKHFEVGTEVYQTFVEKEPALATCFLPISANKWLANLYDIARFKLNQLGIKQIHGGQYCTYAQSNLFYSYRREPHCQGRMASVIWMDD